MSLLVEEEENTRSKQKLSVEIKPSRKIIVARPGSRVHVVLRLDSVHKLELRLTVEDLAPEVARYSIAPEKGETPFTARLDLIVNPEAVGIHSFRVVAQDTLNNGYGVENLVLVILPPGLSMEIVNYLRTILMLYKTHGIQHVIWYLLLHLFRDKGLGFTEIKAVYEFLRGKKLSNSTIGDLIKRMEKKGIIVKRGARYYPGVEDEKLVLQAIDTRRVKAGRRGAKRLLEILSEGRSTGRDTVDEEAVPLAVRRVLREAEKLVKQGRTGKALGLLQHTLIGVRETGRWVLWVKDIFIYKERKAKPRFHYFRSEKLAKILQSMGLKQGFIHTQLVNDLIHDMFLGGYREARRVHYLVKNLGWLSYGEPLILYIAIYPDGTGGFKIESINGEVVALVNYDPRRAVKISKSVIVPGEHVDEYNDNTYFRYK